MSPGRRLILALIVLVFVLVIGTVGYLIIEPDIALVDALYMTLITVSTVGMASGRLAQEMGTAGKLWTIALIFFGIGTASIAFSQLMAMATGGELRRILGRRQLNAKIAALRNHIIVCGFGRVGQFVCQSLDESNQPFVLVDKNTESTEAAERLGYIYQLGDASMESTLESAGIGRARALVTALPGDADNVYVTLTARGMREDLNIVARADQPSTIANSSGPGRTG